MIGKIEKILLSYNISITDKTSIANKTIITHKTAKKIEKLIIPIAVGQSEQLFCPNCDTDDIYSKGKKYMCGYCGEKWAK